ncbi:MAG TPA: DUF1385 domain-containing protein, partial [Miltoncostaeaceae bacterium]|nr:DUF1385 domain-containing protein [Miltoncostaeaceae bacterium]
LLVHGPRHWAAAVRDEDGRVVVAAGHKWTVRVGPLERVPLARGLARLGEAFAVLPAVRRGLPQARFALEDRRTAIVAAGATVAAFILRRRTRSVLAQETIGAVLGLVPMLITMRGSRAAVWHAVEHKSIAAYEAAGPAGIEHAAGQAKEHRRCGSTLVLPLMVSTIVGNTLARRLPGRLPGVRMAISAISIGAAVEVFAFASRRPAHPLARVVHGAGHAMQAGFVTREPTADELLVGRAAMDALIDAETGQRA